MKEELDRERYNDLVVEIFEIERQFAVMVTERGLKEAFLYFAAKDAVISRNNRVYKGKVEIAQYFDSLTIKNVSLQWKPDYIDVSDSGDLAWSYGNYTFAAESAENEKTEVKGIFHTVWKRQNDDSWKYVWD